MNYWNQRAMQNAAVRAVAARKYGAKFGFLFEGSEAYRHGLTPADCPYVLNSPEWTGWYAGWIMAFERNHK
jgi:hypothetical protein